MIGLNTSFPPVAAMAAVQSTPSCAWGCALPMQPVPDAGDAWRCPGCGALAIRDANVDAHSEAPTSIDFPDAIGDVTAMLKDVADVLAGYTEDVLLPPSIPLVTFGAAMAIEGKVRRSLGLLRSEPLTSHARAVHATAIEAAARICEGRARSLFNESGNGLAALEARKCAMAVRRIIEHEALDARPELVAPRERVS